MKRSMKKIGSIITALALLCTVLPATAATTDSATAPKPHRGEVPAYTLYVATDGNDETGDGTAAQPFKTIERAKQAVKTLPKNQGDIVVEIAGGFYEMTELQFTAEDSGNENCTIYYQAAQGERPILSGGTMLDKGAWTLVPASEVPQADSLPVYKIPLSRDSKLRAIYVNDQRANMTLSANNISKSTSNVPTVNVRTTVNDVAQPWAWHARNNIPAGFYLAASVGLTANTRNQQNIEVDQTSGGARWSRNFICIESVTAAGSSAPSNFTDGFLLRYQMPYGAIAQSLNDSTQFNAGSNLQLRNCWEFLNKRGDFYFDQADSTLYYIPRAGEDMNTAEVVVPGVNTVLDIRGIPVGDRLDPDPANDAGRVRHITFSGLTIAHTDYKLQQIEGSYIDSVLGVRTTKSEGYISVQGCVVANAFLWSSGGGGGSNATGMNWHNAMYRHYDVPPAAVQFNAARNIRLLDGEVMFCGYAGIHIENDVQDIEVTGNLISNTLSSAVIVGHPTHIYENDVAGVHDSPQMGLTNGFTFNDTPDDNIPSGGIPARSIAGVNKEKFPAGTEAVPMNIYITNNFIYKTSYGFPGANSLIAFFTTNMQLLRNHLEDCTYGAVNVGWGWCEYDGHRWTEDGREVAVNKTGGPYQGTAEDSAARLAAITTTSRANKINYNRIEDCMRVVNDSGAIYTLGRQGDPGNLPDGGSWFDLQGSARALTNNTPTDPTHNWHPDNWTNYTEMNYNYLNPDPRGEHTSSNDWCNGFHPDEGSTFIKMIGNVLRNGGTPAATDSARLFEVNSWKRKSDMWIAENFLSHNNNQNGAPRAAVNGVNNNTVSRNNIWPQTAHDIILDSGLENRYMHLIPTSILSTVHRELACNVKTLGGTTLNKRGLLTAADEVWIAPADTTVFVEGANMTKSAGDSKTIAAPETEGRYNMFIKYADGTFEQSTYFIDVTSVGGDITNIEDDGRYRVSKASPLTLVLNTADFRFTLNGSSVTNGYRIETEGNWKLVATALLSSSWTEEYNFTTYMEDADKLLPQNVTVPPGGKLTFPSALNDSTKDIWLVNASNTYFDDTGVLASKAVGNAKSITAPLNEGTYVLLVVEAGTENILSESLARVTVREPKVPMDGLDVWFSADEGVTLENGRVAKWASHGIKEGVEAVPSANNQRLPIVGSYNGKPTVRYDNSDLIFDYPVNGLTGMTIISLSSHRGTNTGGEQDSVVFWNESGSWGKLYFSPKNDRVQFRFGSSQSNNNVTYTRPTSIGAAFSVTAAVKNGTSERTYVNGALVNTATGKLGTIANNEAVAHLGRTYYTSWEYCSQEVAELLIYNRALTADEISAVQAYLEMKYAPIDKSELEDLVESAESLNEADYTTSSWAVLQDELTGAKAVLANTDAAQADVDAAYDALLAALSSLEKVILTVTVTTPTIVETLAANLRINVTGENLAGNTLTAYLSVNGELDETTATDITSGTALMKIAAAPAFGADCNVIVKVDGADIQGSFTMTLAAYNPDMLWSPTLNKDEDGKLLVCFAEVIGANSKTGCKATVNGTAYACEKADDNVLRVNVDFLSLEAGTKIVVSGIKYPDLFPSYSFTFALAIS